MIQINLFAQQPNPDAAEHLLENEAMVTEAEPEDDFLTQQLEQFRKRPINLNTTTEEALESLVLLSPLQVSNFISYRKLIGPIINIYELQAVPGWDIETIRVLLPYITVNSQATLQSLFSRFKSGEHSILSRVSLVMEKSEGYRGDSARYAGDPFKLLLRYKYQFQNLLQYGILAEKDAGESLFRANTNPGFDFYSFHFFATNLGVIKRLAIGDYLVNLGQGLIHWQGLAFRKGSETISIKRQSGAIRPFNSTDENRFHRGIAITLGKRNIELTIFSAHDQLDANREHDSITGLNYVSAFQNSGYHRTKNEIDDKDVFAQLVLGANANWHKNNMRFGINSIYYQFNVPIKKDGEPYDLYALSGNSWHNFSVNYSWTVRNLHIFGETASDRNNHIAALNGALASLHPKVDFAILYRNIPPAFHSISANAFTDSREASNEKGLYVGIIVRPNAAWTINAFADQFRVPWLRYRADSPGIGEGYMIQSSWKPDRNLELSCRFRVESNRSNLKIEGPSLPEPSKVRFGSFRAQLVGKISRQISIKSRFDLAWYKTVSLLPERGISAFTEFNYKYRSEKLPLSFNGRIVFFETGGYNSRIYTYESDVMYLSSVPALFDKGIRYYVNVKLDINKKLMLWGRFAQTSYRDKQSIGSGEDKISGNRKTEMRLQILLLL